MSILLMTKAWATALPSGPKMVLLALCDNANDQGECYPSVDTLAIKCSMGVRTVQGHLTAMENRGIVRRELRNGRSTMYHINPRRFDTPLTPAESAPPGTPPQNSHPTPAGSAPRPPQNTAKDPADLAPINVSKPSKNHQLTPPPAVDPPAPPKQKREKAVASRLPENWFLPKAWGDWALAKFKTWTAEHVRETADAFRDHWIAAPDRTGKKLDWEATWRNWCRNAKGPMQAAAARDGAWWSTEAGVMAKGATMDMAPLPGELMATFKARVQSAIDNGGVPPAPPRQSRVGVAAEPEAPARRMPAGTVDNLKAILSQGPNRSPTTTKDEQ